MFHSSLSKWFQTNHCNLSYHCLVHPVFSDTMLASAVSMRGNKCAQIYAADFGWSRVNPMTSTSKAHEALSLLPDRMMSCQLLYTTMPRKWSKASFIISFKMPHHSWKSWSPILPGQMLRNEREKSSRKELVVKFYGPWYQHTCRITF